jgi:hypothetical protein
LRKTCLRNQRPARRVRRRRDAGRIGRRCHDARAMARCRGERALRKARVIRNFLRGRNALRSGDKARATTTAEPGVRCVIDAAVGATHPAISVTHLDRPRLITSRDPVGSCATLACYRMMQLLDRILTVARRRGTSAGPAMTIARPVMPRSFRKQGTCAGFEPYHHGPMHGVDVTVDRPSCPNDVLDLTNTACGMRSGHQSGHRLRHVTRPSDLPGGLANSLGQRTEDLGPRRTEIPSWSTRP